MPPGRRSISLSVSALLAIGIGALAAAEDCEGPACAAAPPASPDEPSDETAHGGAREALLNPSAFSARADERGKLAGSGLYRRDSILGRFDADHDDSYRYRLPYGESVSYPVLQGYGARLSHRGPEFFTVDFGMAEGTPVHSAREGVVLLVEDSFDRSCWAEVCARFANFVVILHSDGTTGEYFHLQKNSVVVAPGDTVRRGQFIARSGNTGYSTVPHLHFGVYRADHDGTTESIGVRFQTREGLLAKPRSGARYENAALNPQGSK